MKTELFKNKAELEQMVFKDQIVRMSDSDEPMEANDNINRHLVIELPA